MANEKITELTELTTPNKADLVAVVDDVAGSPVTKKATLNNALGTPVDYRDFDELATAPDTPASGDLRVYALNDSKLYAKDDAGNVAAIGEGVLPHSVHGRLTTVTGDPFGIDATTPTSIYFTPYNGDTARMYDTTLSAWKNLTFSELEWKATDTQTGDTTNGNAVITDLTDTSMFVVGMEVTGTGIGVDAVIASIDSATQVTLDVNSTADGNDISLTFSAPVDAVYDMFLELQSGAIALRRPVAWTSQTVRATALTELDDVKVLTGDTDSIFIGTVSIDDTTAGVIWGFYNHYNDNVRSLTTAKGMTASILAGYMSTADKQAATWTATTSGTVSSALANAYDGAVTGAFFGVDYQDDGVDVDIDFGSDVVFDQIDVINVDATNSWDTIVVKVSTTGAFAGEETTVTTITDNASHLTKEIPFTATQSRYWMMSFTGTGGGATSGRIYEFNFKYGTTLAVSGVDWGANVTLWNGASLVETVNSDSLIKPGIVEFTAAVTSVDRITFTTGDGVTPALEFDIAPASGDLYNLS